MLEPILKGLVEWIYGMMIDIMSYASGKLLDVLSMDLTYFETTAPIISDIVNVFIALGWALLIGNLVFQLLKSMASGLGFEAEEPKIIFLRTFVFAFLLLSSRQICDIGLSITGKVIELLQLPSVVYIRTPDESMFHMASSAKWLLVIIVGVILMIQMVKLLFEIGERYVITSVLTFFAPLAFSMGGSKNTNDIFKGWVRMYCSMLLMMIMNIVFLKLIMSAMMQMSSGNVLIWLVFVVALTRVARKIDSHIGKIGLNPAQTGDGIGTRMPGMMTMMAVRVMSSAIGKSISGSRGNSGRNGGSGGRRHTSGRNTSRRHSGSGYVNNRNSHNSYSHASDLSGMNQTNTNSGMNMGVNKGGSVESKNSHGISNNRADIKNGNVQHSNVQNGNNPSSVSKGQKGKGNNPINTSVAKNNRNNNSINSNTNKGNSNNMNKSSKESIQSARPPLPRDTKGMVNISKNQKSQSNVNPQDSKIHQNGIDNTQRHQSENTNMTSQNRGVRINDNPKHTVARDNQNTLTQRRETTMARGGNDIRVRKGNVFETNRSQENSKHVSSQKEHSLNETVQKRIDAGYTKGRRNPAAVNKKSKNNFYQKEGNIHRNNMNNDKGKTINRREDNGKQKR